VNRLTGYLECGILLAVGKGVKLIIKQESSTIVDGEDVALQFMILMCVHGNR